MSRGSDVNSRSFGGALRDIQERLRGRLRPHVSVFVLKRIILFPSLAYHQHVSGENGHQKPSPKWRFLKTPASRLRVDGRKRRFSNTMM